MRNENTKSFAIRKLLCLRISVWFILFFKRIWPRLLPFFIVLSLLCSLSWFGIFGILSYWPHLSLLCLLLVAAVGSLFPLFSFRFPTAKDVDYYIEQENGLENQPLSVQADQLCFEDDGNFSAVIWREHQRRMAEKLHHLQIGSAYPNSAAYDPAALRTLFVLLCVCAFSFSYGASGGRLADAFDFRPIIDEASIRIDAWVVPPAYTGVAPIYLTRGEATQLSVPEKSSVIVRIVNGAGVEVKAISEEDGHEIFLSKKKEKMTLDDPIIHFETNLEHSINLSVSSRYKQRQWRLHAIKDQPPTIRWLEKPGRVLAGSLELQYEMDDDYEVTKAFAKIESLFDQDKNASPLYGAPEVKLLLARDGKGKMRTVRDLSSHPWAGSEVKITLVAEDGAGQQGNSSSFLMTLPQRIFINPVARAVSEQRRLLALNASARESVLDMLSALLVRPEDGIKNMTHFLILQSAWTRLSMSETEEQLRDVAQYLWKIALAIEGDQFGSVQQRLKQAQAALRDALRYGASTAEIERLVADLRQAMGDYISALAEKAPGIDNASNTNISPSDSDLSSNDTTLSNDALQEKLNSIEEMAKMGSSSAAEQLLAEIEQTLDHLRVRKGDQEKRKDDSQTVWMKEKIDQLGDLMRRQQEILNDTHRLEIERRHEEITPEKQQKQSETLKKRQTELQSELSALEKELSAQNIEQSNALKNAEEEMKSAGADFDSGNHEMSIQHQSGALEALRQGAQDVLNKMRETLKKARNNQNTAFGPRDPLGRSLSSEIDKAKENTIAPQENERTRARQILEEIRKRLGNDRISEEEKTYLEELLHFN
ncbi:putative membrane protein [Bartonella australis AUST/NH1]|uniref:Putative membrane protein n=1 Tax=Bartonella australis (strain Aust/NH1) TaxID=1094489 RepID=M1P0E6_BARAA|nr:TIGR02302 family protein [Bartonella australis]AGF75117.1 putative membrane protein [Bartonella australis AUST/NH1]